MDLRTLAKTLSPTHRRRQAQWDRIFAAVPPGTVRSGPFAGMTVGEAATGSHIPKRLGTYEMELHDSIEACIARQPPVVANIGAGEGYYAVGLARRLPDSTVLAFDIDELARSHCRETARLNDVNVMVSGECTASDLQQLPPGSLVLSDCEGCEVALLDPATAPSLAHVDLLVECHDFAVAGATATLVARFTPTHDCSVIQPQRRENRSIAGMRSDDVERALDESRTLPQAWLVAVSRSRQGDPAAAG